MQPSDMQFTTAPGKHCKGCVFEHEHSSVCHEAVRVALRSGMQDCEYSGLIYVLKPVDTRQLELITQGENNGPE